MFFSPWKFSYHSITEFVFLMKLLLRFRSPSDFFLFWMETERRRDGIDKVAHQLYRSGGKCRASVTWKQIKLTASSSIMWLCWCWITSNGMTFAEVSKFRWLHKKKWKWKIKVLCWWRKRINENILVVRKAESYQRRKTFRKLDDI